MPVDGLCGALWQMLSTTEWLLTKFKGLKCQPLNQYLVACVNLAWKKPIKHYELSDTPPLNRLSVFLHPSQKMVWFERNLSEGRGWIKAVEQTISASWNDRKRRWPWFTMYSLHDCHLDVGRTRNSMSSSDSWSPKMISSRATLRVGDASYA